MADADERDASGTRARVGADVGGTFTDVVSIRDGAVRVEKTPSTPETPETGVLDGLDAANEHGLSFEGVEFLGHGTTVATNAVLEGEWADTALVTTAGFRDVLEIGRQARPTIDDFSVEKPDPVVPRDRRYEVAERLDERGAVLESLDESRVRDLATDLDAADVESVAIAFLYSFENDDHERRVRDLLGESGLDCSYSLSSSVLPEIREYERTLATALNAALAPVMDRYLGALDESVRERGIDAPLSIMHSNGGIVAADAARERPVGTLLSGPAAGVRGASYVAERCGIEDAITMDMGGTSCDVSVVTGGEPLVSTETEVGDYPVGVPAVDIHTVGAGGGSIAWLDAGGALRVGPRSAGADPGPVCYGRGGTDPTVTDAQFLLGRFDPAAFDTGLDPDREAVRAAVERAIAEPLGMSIEDAAAGIVDVANANIERALRVVSIERGHDPREFGLVAFGGAGPLHAPAIADALGVPQVIVPRAAGVLSALGLLASDVTYDHSASRVRRLDAVDPGDLEAAYRKFAESGREQLAADALPETQRRFERSADLRYVGQSHDLRVSVPEDLDADAVEQVIERFHDRHSERYGHANPEETVELVTLRLRARGVVEPPDLRAERGDGTLTEAVTGCREVVYDGDARETDIYDRAKLPTEAEFDGPAVIEGTESTTVVQPRQRVRVDEDANLLVEVAP